MLENFKVICHSCIKYEGEKIIYIDPFKIKEEYKDAYIIFITHSHYDHFSVEDINKIKKENTIIIITKDLEEKAINLGFKKENVIIVEPNKEYEIEDIKIKTVPAYNINKKFHPKENNWVGYIIYINGISYYISGDTDITEENKNVKCDVAFVPIGGTFTMDFKEAASLINEIKPKIVVPIHYGEIVGTKQDAVEFEKLIDKNTECRILIK